MTQDRLGEFSPVTGEEFRPALGKLWMMAIVFALMVPVGGLAALAWWYQVELPGGKVLSTKAGIVGLIGMPVGAFLSLIALAFAASAKQLVIGANCVQLISKGRVVVHIPYQNVAETYTTGEGTAGTVGLKLRDRNDPATLVPSWTRDRYEIQSLVYGKPVTHLQQVLNARFAEFRAAGK
jgi:hypothetical protein